MERIVLAALCIFAFFGVSTCDPVDKVHSAAKTSDWQRACSVFCEGPILEAVASYGIFKDDKTFVDMSLRVDPEDALDAFSRLGPNPTRENVTQFVGEFFTSNSTDLLPWLPPDWKSNPDVTQGIADEKYTLFAKSLNKIWLDLGRKTSDSVRKNPQRHSIIAVPHGFLVPGGRFTESYYWDNYWIVLGMLRCGMVETAKGVLENMLYLLKHYLLVPNGTRCYYLARSQQPVLSEIVREYYETTGDASVLSEALDLLQIEHNLFMKDGRAVSVIGASGKLHTLNRFRVTRTKPRPESYRADEELVEGMGGSQKEQVYSDIAAACETGWDFSTRWFSDPATMRTVDTSNVVPVDLNCWMYRLEDNIAYFAMKVGMFDVHEKFRGLASRRQDAIEDVLYHKESSQWYDYDVAKSAQRRRASVSNYFPLWAGVVARDITMKRGEDVARSIRLQGILGPAGLYTTLQPDSEQQWDFPNTWAPAQHLVIQGLRKAGGPLARSLALSIAQRWVLTNYVAFRETKAMHEKYDGREIGAVGGGGEYEPQTGFGWTNGVVFDLLATYGKELSSEWKDDLDRVALNFVEAIV